MYLLGVIMKPRCKPLLESLLAEPVQIESGKSWFIDFYNRFNTCFDCGLSETNCEFHNNCKVRIRDHYLSLQPELSPTKMACFSHC
jgi:hypothetical protein